MNSVIASPFSPISSGTISVTTTAANRIACGGPRRCSSIMFMVNIDRNGLDDHPSVAFSSPTDLVASVVSSLIGIIYGSTTTIYIQPEVEYASVTHPMLFGNNENDI
ncbi:hypothetical protein HAX54_052319 [Datura stramonium]|uniref:Uncharacterized protein n=1 Tax=Datura stramonium TaxID=4076 RepID=A0ABS8SZD2_DATST|nr:hypothetical protein [Datura stramonium]